MIKYLLAVVICMQMYTAVNSQVSNPETKSATPVVKVHTTKSVANSIPDTVVGRGERRAFNARRKHANAVETVFRKAGATTDKEIIAALANGWHECTWNPTCRSGSFRGFFQIGNFALPKSVSRGELYDPKKNAQAIVSHPRFRQWLNWCKKNPNASANKMAYQFSAVILRPKAGLSAARGRTAERWHKSLKSTQ